MRVRVDHELCMGHARCTALGPDFYELDEEGFNVLRERSEVLVPKDLEDQARKGCDACPEGAITVTEE